MSSSPAPWAPTRAPWPRAQSVALFFRVSALGGTLVLPFLGAATVAPGMSAGEAWGLAIVGLCYHVFAYVLNDVVDLPIDRREPRRARSPLVRGVVAPRQALACALVQPPLALAVATLAGAGATSITALVVSFVLIATYDLLGKRSAVPWLLDLLQGIGWASLLLFGAAMVGRSTSLTWVLFAYITVFIVMANGVHGSLRDLANDARCGVRSTAILMGATADDRGAITIPRRLRAYGWFLHTTLVAIAIEPLLAHQIDLSHGARVGTIGVVLAVAATATWCLRAAVRSTTQADDLRSAGTLHLLLLLATPVVVVFASLDGSSQIAIATLFLVPLIALGWLPDAMRWVTRAARPEATRTAGARRPGQPATAATRGRPSREGG